jgi:threonine/homoserine/homoserine lactone efflux protein
VIKFLGAGYLISLGVRAIGRSRRKSREGTRPLDAPPTVHLLAHATISGILNPKVAVFFLAFLPQFVDPARGFPFLQFVLLGLSFSLLGFLGDSAVAILAGRARSPGLAGRGSAHWRERLTGAVLIGLSIRLAFERHR